MADDTRQSSNQAPTAPLIPPPPPASPNDMEAPSLPLPPPRTPANTMPGGTAHTAGGRSAEQDVQSVTYWQALKTIRPSHYLTFHKRPCVRDGQLTGIGTGFAFGGLAAVLRKPVFTCCNWAVWSYISTSIIAYQWCQNQRAKEKAGMREAMAIMAEKRAKIEAKKAERRRAMEEQQRIEEERRLEEQRKSWRYWASKNLKFW